MTGIGEETGNIEDMLEKLADYYDEEVEITTQSVLAAMETADHRIYGTDRRYTGHRRAYAD